MTVPRTDPDVRAPASPTREESTRANEGQLSALQVAAGALAAASAAVVTSFFGVAGTVIGAAVVSVVSTVGAAVYTESMRRAGRRLIRSPQSPVDRSAGRPPLPASLDPRRSRPRRRGRRWALLAATALAVFGLAMVLVTTVELIGHKPVSALVGGSNPSGTTTLGALTDAGGGDGRVQQAPASSSSTPTDGTAPASQSPPISTSGADSTAPSAPTSSAPHSTPATSTTAPAEQPAEEPPATPAPEPSASAPSQAESNAESNAEPGQPSSAGDPSP